MSDLTYYIADLLPEGYIFSGSDLIWLNHVYKNMSDDFNHYNSKSINEKIVQAVKKSISEQKEEFVKNEKIFTSLCDPWELFIDAGVCDEKCNPK